MKKIYLLLFSLFFASFASASNEPREIIRNGVKVLDSCATIAAWDFKLVATDENVASFCLILPTILDVEKPVFFNGVLTEETRGILRKASAIGEGIYIRSRIANGLIVRDDIREKYTSYPYNELSDSKLPVALCAMLSVFKEASPENAPDDLRCNKGAEK